MAMDSSINVMTEVIRKLGLDPSAVELPEAKGRGWALPCEKTVLFLEVVDMDGLPLLRLTAPLVFMPTRDLLPFYRRILDVNSELIDGALAMNRDAVYYVDRQAMDGLTAAALEALLQRIRKISDLLADMLVGEFQNARYWRPM